MPSPPRSTPVSETRIMTWVLAQLQEHYPEGLWERQNVVVAQAGDRFVSAGTIGQADIRGLYHGIYFEFEVKREGKKQTPAQVRRQNNINDAGGVYAVVHRPQEAFDVVNATLKRIRGET